MRRRLATTGRIPTRLLQFNPHDWLKPTDLPEADPHDWEISTDQTVRHYAAALTMFENAQDDYVIAHPYRAIADALIHARQDATRRFPDEPFDPSTI